LAFPLIFPKWVKINLKQSFTAQKKLFKEMAGHSAVAFIAAGIIENIDVLFVQRYLNTYEAGLLGGVGRVALLFSILAYALSSVLNPRVAKYTDRKNLSAYFKKALLLAGASIAAILVYLPFSKFILLATIGEQYLPGLEVMNILVASSLLTLAVVPFIAMFFSFDKPWYFSVSGILQLVIIVGGNYLFVPVFGLEGSAWTRLVSRIVLFAFTIILVWYYFRKKRSN
jgi:O-antigen/teichoic acid export membrane protein